MRTRALVVDDSDMDRSVMVEGVRLAYSEAEIAEAGSGADALELIQGNAFNLLITDLVLGEGIDGLKIIEHARDVLPRIGVVVVTGQRATQPDVQKARGLGARHLLFKPVQPDLVRRACRDAMRYRSLAEKAREAVAPRMTVNPELGDIAEIVGDSPLVKAMKADIYRFARMDSYPVLVTGETGTGKELVAKAIHRFSPRARGPLIPVNLAEIDRERFESEIFGHVRGAFTGADRDNPGAVGRAEKGILFLDEIEALSLALQGKLLRFLESREFQRMGEKGQLRYADVRIVLATNRNLDEMVLEGEFREDLYFRVNVCSIALPPLRVRGADIAELVKHFIQVLSGEVGVKVERVEDGVYEAAAKHGWPGNVRQLRTTVLRALMDVTKANADPGVVKAEVFVSHMHASQPLGGSMGLGSEDTAVDERVGQLIEDAAAKDLLAQLWYEKVSWKEICRRIPRNRITLHTWLRRMSEAGKITGYPRRLHPRSREMEW